MRPRSVPLLCSRTLPHLGRTNSYTILDPSSLTPGAYTAQSAAANPGCYFAQSLLASAEAMQLTSALQSAAVEAGDCPAITDPNFKTLLSCSGYSTWGGRRVGVVVRYEVG